MTTENPDSHAPERSAPASSAAEGDAAYLCALRAAGWLRELAAPQLELLAGSALATPDAGTTPDAGVTPDTESRRLDLVLAYYFAPDPEAAARRRAEDRFFLHDVDEPSSAGDLVSRLVALTPELGSVTLERIGTDDGPLVLRAGDHLAAVTDPEEEEDLDTGQIDLSELEESTTITVRGLVRAVNVLLDRFGIRERLVPLLGDGRREAYGALPVADAMALYRAGALDVTHAERLFEFAAW